MGESLTTRRRVRDEVFRYVNLFYPAVEAGRISTYKLRASSRGNT